MAGLKFISKLSYQEFIEVEIVMNLEALIFLLMTYFGSEKHVKSLAIVNCMDQNNSFKLISKLFLSGFSVVNLPLNENINISLSSNYFQDFMKNSHLLGIYLDFNCNFADKFIQSVSYFIEK